MLFTCYTTNMMKIKNKKRSVISKTLIEKILGSLGNYVKSQFILTILIVMVSWITLSYLNIRFPFLLAMFTGAASVVPVLGITLAAVVVALVAIFDGIRFLPNVPPLVEGLVMMLIYGALNIAVDYFLSPYLTGKIVKISPFVLLFGVIIGTATLGVLGALLAVPAILVGKTVIDHYNSFDHE